jgi:hypothetical protein
MSQSRKKAFFVVLTALSAVVLAGFVSVSLAPSMPGIYPNDRANHHPLQEPVAYSPNDRANHHPLHPNG